MQGPIWSWRVIAQCMHKPVHVQHRTMRITLYSTPPSLSYQCMPGTAMCCSNEPCDHSVYQIICVSDKTTLVRVVPCCRKV